MLFSHIHLILTGISTVESFAARDQHQREADVLQREYGYLWHNMEKKKVKKKWNEEWGGSEVHARWKFGTLRQMWEQEMGRNPIGWFCEHPKEFCLADTKSTYRTSAWRWHSLPFEPPLWTQWRMVAAEGLAKGGIMMNGAWEKHYALL